LNREEEKVRFFYDHYGWITEAGLSGTDALFRSFSPAYYPYHQRVNARTLECFAGLNGRLLMAGGGDLPETHVVITKRFSETTCIDISRLAIDIARSKLADHGEFILGSILDIPKPADHFDAAYCAHVIYHIDREQQERAVRELVRVTRPGGRVVVIYINDDSIPARILQFKSRLPLLWRLKRKKPISRPDITALPPLYFFAHPLNWWSRFEDLCDVEIKPWDVMGNAEEEGIFVSDGLASLGYRMCAWFEDRYPATAARWWTYPLIVLTKKAAPVQLGQPAGVLPGAFLPPPSPEKAHHLSNTATGGT
jgi:SAM-dependent methyltransferase